MPPLNSDIVVYSHVHPDQYSNRFMDESKQMFVPDVIKFLPDVSEIKH